MVGEIVNDPFDRFFDTYPLGVIECTSIDVELSQREPLDRLRKAITTLDAQTGEAAIAEAKKIWHSRIDPAAIGYSI